MALQLELRLSWGWVGLWQQNAKKCLQESTTSLEQLSKKYQTYLSMHSVLNVGWGSTSRKQVFWFYGNLLLKSHINILCRKSTKRKITTMNSISWKHTLFFLELNITRTKTQSMRNFWDILVQSWNLFVCHLFIWRGDDDWFTKFWLLSCWAVA